ncbi:hypothetical protein [Streptomyces zaomyceticus]|uniref:hypothetical protein n=1 Tax=Streptomyces zaomyceticus TaxID=68286 RepID=UPI003442A5F8
MESELIVDLRPEHEGGPARKAIHTPLTPASISAHNAAPGSSPARLNERLNEFGIVVGAHMNRALFGLSCTLILTASVSTTGCATRYSSCPGAGQRPEGLNAQDLVGTYAHSIARLTLRDDGTFATVGWPADLEGAAGLTRDRTGSGTWTLSSEHDEAWPVAFTFHKISDYLDSDVSGDSYGNGLHVGGSRENPRLYEYVGDPDSCELATLTRVS